MKLHCLHLNAFNSKQFVFFNKLKENNTHVSASGKERKDHNHKEKGKKILDNLDDQFLMMGDNGKKEDEVEREKVRIETLPAGHPVYLVVDFNTKGERKVSLITKNPDSNTKTIIDSVSLDGDIEEEGRKINLGSKDIKFEFTLKPDRSITPDPRLTHIISSSNGNVYPYDEHGFKLKVEMKIEAKN